MAELLEFDPTSEDAANSPLSVMTSSYRVLAHAYPAPQLNVLYASSIDTEGELPASRRYSNRSITMTIEMTDVSGALTRALQAKVAKIGREGGTLKRTLATGQVIVFDLVTAEQFDPSFDIAYYSSGLVQVQLVLGARPYGRGAAVTLSSHSEATLPALVFTETAIAGDGHALGRLVITEGQAVDQAWLAWGLQSKNYNSATSAALFFQAESRTPLGSATTATGPAGASASSVISSPVGTIPQAIMSTQAASGGAHMSHVGDFKVFARVQFPSANTGQVTLSWEWAEGDFLGWTSNTAYVLPAELYDQWALVDLGQVHLSTALHGAQQWQGHLVAKSTAAADTVYVDHLILMPVTEGYGEASSVLRAQTPTAFTARDEFNQSTAALSGLTAPIGGTWTTTGATGDFLVNDTSSTVLSDPVLHTAKRAASDSASTGRFATLGSAVTNSASQVDVQQGVGAAVAFRGGALARYVSTTSWLAAVIESSSVVLYMSLSGTVTALGVSGLPTGASRSLGITLRLQVLASGTALVFASAIGGQLQEVLSEQHPALATGGTLASGKIGIYDTGAGGSAGARSYDNFAAWVPLPDAAVFASQQLEIRSDGVSRTDPTGTSWRSPTSYEGDYLLIPPAGAEGRTLRMIVKASRNAPRDRFPDAGIDDISATLTYTPRFLVIP